MRYLLILALLLIPFGCGPGNAPWDWGEDRLVIHLWDHQDRDPPWCEHYGIYYLKGSRGPTYMYIMNDVHKCNADYLQAITAGLIDYRPTGHEIIVTSQPLWVPANDAVDMLNAELGYQAYPKPNAHFEWEEMVPGLEPYNPIGWPILERQP